MSKSKNYFYFSYIHKTRTQNKADDISHWCCQGGLGLAARPIERDTRPQVNLVEHNALCRANVNATDNSQGAIHLCCRDTSGITLLSGVLASTPMYGKACKFCILVLQAAR